MKVFKDRKLSNEVMKKNLGKIYDGSTLHNLLGLHQRQM